MIAATKRALPWINGLLAYLVWRLGATLFRRRPAGDGPVTGRLCVLQINSLGDVLMVTPLLRALVEALGPGKVDVVVSERAASLLENFPGLARRVLIKTHLRWRHPASVREFIRVVRDLRAYRYQAVLDASRLMQSAWMAFLACPQRRIGLRLARDLGPVRIGGFEYLYTDEVPVDPADHMIRQNLALLAPLGIPPSTEAMELTPRPTDHHRANQWLATRGLTPDHPYAVLHPGGKWPPKRWPADRFRSVAQRLQGSGLGVVLTGDANDQGLLRTVAEGVTPPPHILAGELGLGAVGALIQRACLFIGNDSGLSHVAAAVGTPVLALFGPTFRDRTGPLGATGRAIMKPIACRPCRLYFTRDRCERGHNYCMDLIEVDEVWASAQSLLQQARARQPVVTEG